MVLAMVLMVTMPLFAERVTPETARKVAATFLNNNGAKSAQLTDLTKEAGFTNLYIFNAEQGFVVMAADDCVQPILGYSLTGEFVAENMPSNVSGWLQGYNDEIQYAIDNQMRATSEITRMWKELVEGNAKAGKATAVVNALVQTQWDQNGVYYYSGGQLQIFELYNNLCPYDNTADERTVTGCVATAMAQIMKYWDYPSQGIGSHSYTPSTRPELGVQSANFGETTYQWADMPNKLSMTSTTTQINAVATLMYHCGVSVDMMYDISGNDGSGAYSEDIPDALYHYFNYKPTAIIQYRNSYETNAWMSMLKTELDAGRPLQYSGSGSGGHAFICDGYDSSNKFHFNWGWSGNNDGYFELSNLNPGSGGAGGGGYVFNNDQSAIFGIEPGSTIAAPTNLTYTLSGLNDITLTWDGVSAASSYNVYCDGNLVGNTTSTTYSETVPFGTHDYFVRCIDANSQLSLPSNTVTVTIAYQTPVVTDLTATLSGNNANLSWTAPAWCYPETPLTTLTYGDGSVAGSLGTGGTGNDFYWGHRYLASDLTQYNGKVVYKISFYVNEAGAYDCYVFKGTAQYSTYYYPSQELAHLSITASQTGWVDIDLSETIEIDGSQDLWVFVFDPVGRQYPATYCSFSENLNGSYYSNYYPNANVSGYLPGTINNTAWLIRTLVTDGTYTYNLYDGTATVASNISNTTYTVNNIANNTAHRYTLKTNFNGGLTGASNMAGLTIGEASLASLNLSTNDKMTITESSKLTVSGALSDVNADNLILENGAQLVNGSNGVLATVKKTVTAYTQEGGWNLIASPIADGITPSSDNGLLTNSYDLYTFDQSQDLEWRNYEAEAFSIENKTGYLYANSGNLTTISFAGALANAAAPTTLVYDGNATWKGFNLIGNPYPCNAYIDRSFYVLNTDGSDFIEGSNPITPCSAILVQAQNSDDNSVTFSKEALDKKVSIVAKLTTMDAKGERVIDQARVCFDEADQLSKFTMGQGMARIYIPQGNYNYAVACANGQNEMPLNFKAAKNGTYTLAFEVENLDLDYLHLIDNMTGEEVDVLAMPTYTFEAKTSDYASRFHLVFAENDTEGASTGSAAFAYITDGEIIINVADACDASLQVVDMMGRVVLAGDAMNRVSTNGMTAGVYVLRLINGEQVKTQKIVVR